MKQEFILRGIISLPIIRRKEGKGAWVSAGSFCQLFWKVLAYHEELLSWAENWFCSMTVLNYTKPSKRGCVSFQISVLVLKLKSNLAWTEITSWFGLQPFFSQILHWQLETTFLPTSWILLQTHKSPISVWVRSVKYGLRSTDLLSCMLFEAERVFWGTLSIFLHSFLACCFQSLDGGLTHLWTDS